MGCFIALLALISPRIALGAVWLFTDAVDQAYQSMLWPILGFLFLPWTTLIYALAFGPQGVSTAGWFFVALGLLADLGSYGSTRYARGRSTY